MPLSKEEFEKRFQGRLLVFLTEAWACRKEDPSQLGLLLDFHHRRIKALLGEMYNTLAPAPVNGKPEQKQVKP